MMMTALQSEMLYQRAKNLQISHRERPDLLQMLLHQGRMNQATETREEVSQDLQARRMTDRAEMVNSVSREIQDLQEKAEALTEEKDHFRTLTAEMLTETENHAAKDLQDRTETHAMKKMNAATDRTEVNAELPADRGMHHMAETALRQQTRSSRDVIQEIIATIKKEIVTAERMATEKIQSAETAVVIRKADALI